MRRPVEGERVLDVLHPDEELQQPLEPEAEAPGVRGALPPQLQVPVEAVVRHPAQPRRQHLVTRLPQTAAAQLANLTNIFVTYE